MDTEPREYRHADEMPASHRAAERIVPQVLALVGPVRSVVDLGGGDGGWLRVFQASGVEQIRLIDAPEVAPHLVIDRRCFVAADLRSELPPARRFDLAVCLECAEHLPAARAQPLVDWLTQSADLVLFSAAIPGQDGKGHVNTRLPSYWRDLFRARGFQRHDLLRPRILGDEAVPWWYRQNLFLFTADGAGRRFAPSSFVPEDFLLVHESAFAGARGLRQLLREVPSALRDAIRRRTAWRDG
jgi:SAM-dependent methyltransferase